MTASNQGAIRPISDRIESALLLTESATGLLDKKDVNVNVDIAAKTLIEAGLTLLGKQGDVYMLTENHHRELFDALMTCKCALKLVLRDEDTDQDGAVQAVVKLVHDTLDAHGEVLDYTTMSLGGLVVEVRSWEADDNG